MEITHQGSVQSVPWGKGKLVGQKAPLKQRVIWGYPDTTPCAWLHYGAPSATLRSSFARLNYSGGAINGIALVEVTQRVFHSL